MRFLVTAYFLLCSFFFVNAQADVPAPTIDATSFLLLDAQSNKIILASNPDMPVEPASITKAMAVYVVFNEIRYGGLLLQDKVKISKKAYKMRGSRMFIELGAFVSVEDLLKGVIVQSGNDATVALAEHIAGSEESFVKKMNITARNIGMKSTNFVNSTGWPAENHYSTSRDMAILGLRLIKDFPEFYPLFSLRSFKHNKIVQDNRNELLWRAPSVDGIKTGHTKNAGYCLLSSAIRDGRRLISVVIGANTKRSRSLQSQKLLNYGFRFFDTIQPLPSNTEQVKVRIWGGEEDYLRLGLLESSYVTLPKNETERLKKIFKLPSDIRAPIKRGDRIGIVELHVENRTILEKPIYALHDIPEGGIVKRLLDHIVRLFHAFLSLF